VRSSRSTRRPPRLLVIRPASKRSLAVPRVPRTLREPVDERSPRRNGAPAPDLLIVHNPASTRFTWDAVNEAARTVLQPRGLEHRIVAVPGTRDAERSVRRHVARAIEGGCRRVVAAGGDGTVSMVAQCMARRRDDPPVSLGIIPAGTTNVLARELGLPLSLEEAMAVIADADRAIELDAIRVGRKYIFTQVGVGPDALMIRDTPRQGQLKLGRLAYMITFARRALRFRPRWFTIRFDGGEVRERAWQIIVANVGTAGAPPFTWGPRIDPTDGTVDLCVFHVAQKRDLGKLLWRFLTNRHKRDASTRFYRVRDSAVIDTKQPVLVQGDGEIIGRTPLTLRVVPGALRVLVARPVEGAVEAPPAAETPPLPVAHATDERAPEAAPQGASGDALLPAPGTVGADVEQMIGQRSRTWPLQGKLRHPLAAIEAYDAALFLRLNTISLGETADRALEAISRFFHYGEGWAIVILGLLLVDLQKGLEAAALALPSLWATMLTVNIVLKRVFRRRRPFIAYVKARVIGPRPRDFSFPSGHAAAGFAGAVLLSYFLPAWSPLFFLFALAVSFSRIYLGVHYPSDVLMGAFAGSVLAVVYRAVIHLLLSGGA